ncbi:Fic family protein [Sphingomonas yabuuchiae]|uniref:Fic family protein n=1 Tax=Sphingomonas yabuuchiae TaxID=172044 RepID=UPI003D973915
MLKQVYHIPKLPPASVIENVTMLREVSRAHRYLAELKGRAGTIPNQGILIDTLSLQEAKASSEIENIVTTQDELFQASAFPEQGMSPAAKEVSLYRDALKCGFDRLHERKGLLTNNDLIAMFHILKGTDENFRSTPGTALKNESSGEIVYVPPQSYDEVVRHMNALERFINEPGDELDPLIRMAIIHHQFESIHPFSDGNGRIGRILNVLYLTQQGLLEIPILYLSRYITKNKSDYYRLLQAVREKGVWDEWIVYMVRAVGDTAIQTIDLITQVRFLMSDYKEKLRNYYSKIYSQDLLNNLFKHPYTRIEFVQNELGVTRQTAARYLDQLANGGLLVKHSAGRANYYINAPLVNLLTKGEGRT